MPLSGLLAAALSLACAGEHAHPGVGIRPEDPDLHSFEGVDLREPDRWLSLRPGAQVEEAPYPEPEHGPAGVVLLQPDAIPPGWPKQVVGLTPDHAVKGDFWVEAVVDLAASSWPARAAGQEWAGLTFQLKSGATTSFWMHLEDRDPTDGAGLLVHSGAIEAALRPRTRSLAMGMSRKGDRLQAWMREDAGPNRALASDVLPAGAAFLQVQLSLDMTRPAGAPDGSAWAARAARRVLVKGLKLRCSDSRGCLGDGNLRWRR